jgi:hypothetical protein
MQMRRLSGALLAGALFMLPAFSQSAAAQDPPAQPAAQQPAAQPAAEPAAEEKKPAGPELKYNGDAVIVAYAVNPGKEADYDKVLELLKAALAKNPARAAQAAGWKVYKSSSPLTGDPKVTSYIHIISPVVKDADYSIVNIVYENSTDQEKLDFYNLYKGALMKPLMQIQGPLALDLK